MRWTVQQVARALGVTAPAGLNPVGWLAGVSIDSRSVGRGELFFAIHGPRHDGHAFVAAVLAAGAAAAVVDATRIGEFPAEIRGQLFGVHGHACGASTAGAGNSTRMGRARCRRRRLGGQDHHKRNSGGARWLEVPRTEDRRKFE